jgi:hypothetical protein
MQLVPANPFRPGAGHMPLYLAGREEEKNEFRKLLRQSVILDNLVLTGLRGVGKTVLLDTLKPIAINEGWLWVGTDLTEATSLSEENIAVRLIADLSVVTSGIEIGRQEARRIGFATANRPGAVGDPQTLSFEVLGSLYANTPGLVADKLKATLETAWKFIKTKVDPGGLIFAYDEAQNMSDRSDKEQFPLSLMLDVFQSLQKKGIPMMLVLAGLPTLFPRLVEARTFAERMFRVVFLDRLDREASQEAIRNPIQQAKCPFPLREQLIDSIVAVSGGYPYFIQFICREVYDTALQMHRDGKPLIVSMSDITRKLDSDFFAGRWARATDRQRELLRVVAHLDNCDEEFTVHEVVEKSKEILENSFGASHVNQMFGTLSGAGLIYKNRHGKYSFAVPLLGQFIRRQEGGNTGR